MPLEKSFIEWISSCIEILDFNPEFLEEWDPADLDWFRMVYDALGPISPGRLRLMMEEERDRSARIALSAVERDVRVDHKAMPSASLEKCPSQWAEGGQSLYFLHDEIFSLTVQGAVMEIGDRVQGEIMERDHEAWPVCPVHKFGLHLENSQNQVVWWCKTGEHVVRTIYPK
jgi:hypothetical protein